MIKNYLKIALRNLKGQPTVSAINIFGLAASMSICLLIILFIYNQRSYDRFHSESDRLYRVVMDFKPASSNVSDWFATSPTGLADILETEYAGIKRAVNLRASFGGEAKSDDQTILPLQGFFTEPDFLELFTFEIIQGDPVRALSQPGNVILTSEASATFFGEENPVGKTLSILGDRDYVVAGVIAFPGRSHLQFEALASLSSLRQMNSSPENWSANISSSYTYLLLEEGASVSDIEAQFSSMIGTRFPELDDVALVDFELQPVTKINLGRVLNNEIGIVLPGVVLYFLTAFAAIILMVAFFNYVGLMIARSIRRGKEVGVRKVLGAFRHHLTSQFIAESIVTALFSLVIAVLFLRLILPQFNSLFIVSLSATEIGTNYEANFIVILIFVAFSILTGFLAGIYPSIYLSKFKPAVVLKGVSTIQGFSSTVLRRVIVVAQFSFSLFFIISSMLLFRQFNHLANTDYGFDEEYVVNVALQDVPYERFANEISSHPSVSKIAATSKVPALGSIDGRWVQSDSIADPIRANAFFVDENYLSVMGLEIDAGRNFSGEYGSDPSNSVILNQNALRSLELGQAEQALGSEVRIEDSSYQVIGVVQNFISSSPLQNDEPAFLLNQSDQFFYAAVKLHPESFEEFLPYLKETWYELGSSYSIQFRIFDEQLQENPIIAVFGDFTSILWFITLFTIAISCLGLFGLALNTTQSRLKEISIRKILGASTINLTVLLSENYLKMMGIAVLIGGSVAWILNGIWLRNISNSIEMDAGLFIAGVLGMIALGLITVSSQAIRAALHASVEKLRSE